MTRRIEFYPLAEADLINLYNYIATNSGAVRADRYIQRIQRLCLGLSEFPERGTPRPDLVPGVRTLSMDRRVLVAFTVTEELVLILRILYSGRNLSRVDVPMLH